MYIRDTNYYKLFNEYNEKKSIKDIDKKVINALFINNNHFEIICPKLEKNAKEVNNIIKKIDIKEITKNLNKYYKHNTLNSNLNFNITQNKAYAKYNRNKCEQYYDEIFAYLKDNNKIPDRVKYNKKK